MVRATIAATLLATVCATTSDSFEAYKAKFDKVYKSVADEAHAADCWKENVQGIQQRQSMNSLAEFDENDFTDLCWEDFERERLGAKFEEAPKMPRKFHPDATTAIRDILEANPSVDWRTSGALAPVQDQGQCGSCWSFGTTAAIEAQHFLWAESGKGKFVKLSEQELVSCDHFKDNTGEDKGCQGGWPERVYHWMLQNNGLTTEQNYPYTSGGGQDGTCLTSAETPKAFNIKDFHDLGADEEYVAAYVAKYGPVTIGAQATGDWQSYKGGILTTGCGSKQANHAIAIIGYGSEAGQDYWLIRNSWGTSWGENGHLRLARGRNCNGVVGHVSSTLFGERSLCLEECGSKMCCGGDCCDDGGRETCCSDNDGTAKGCATSGQECCGGSGGYMPCSDSSLCAGGACCDGDGQQLLPDSLTRVVTCCDKESVCGDMCLVQGEPWARCCNGHVDNTINGHCCAADSDCKGSAFDTGTCCDGVCCSWPNTACDSTKKTCVRGSDEEMV